MRRIISFFKRILAFIGIFLFIGSSNAEVTNDDRIYDPNIQSVMLHKSGKQLTEPLIVFQSGKQLELSFDDLSDEAYIFRYTLIHCTHDWETTDLEPIEYLGGYFEDEILDYTFSLNAIPEYIHYKLTFPSADMRIKLSGNYIIKVYLDSPEDENVILTRRFYVVEPISRIEASIPFYPKVLDYTRKKQQIDLVVHTPDLFSAEPEKRVNVSIRQNGRWDNMMEGLKPTGMMMSALEYNYRDGIVFDGGNQFRNFDMKSYWYQSPQIRRIINEQSSYRVILHTDGKRSGKPYESLDDLNGMRFIKARNDQRTDIEGEYAWVEFNLKHSEIKDADVYIMGQLNDWHLDAKNKMRYNRQTGMYYGEMFLKQGYYNYNYVVLRKGETIGDVTIIEGDHWDTFNDYKIYVYYTERVPEYDRLVGYLKFLSH